MEGKVFHEKESELPFTLALKPGVKLEAAGTDATVGIVSCIVLEQKEPFLKT